MDNLRRRYHLNPVINLSGPLTMYGTSISSPALADVARDALLHHWDMGELFQRSGELIAQWSGTEAGVLTASSAAGITLAVAATISGNDMGRIRKLPDTTSMKNEIVIQKGHAINFGAPIEQMIRLAGGVVREVGTVNKTTVSDIESAIGPNTAAAMFVVSHHTAQYGYVQLTKFVELCHRRGIPVIVDGAAQDHQIARLVASGADLIVVSLQKYLAGPTGGIVCGRKDLVRSVYLQNLGIGRPMKIGKEGLFGAMIALEERMELDLDQWAAEQIGKATFLASQLTGIPGIDISLVPDAVGQPVTRVRLSIDEATTGISAEAICQALRGGTPTIKPRSHHTDEGWFFLEPNHITEEEMVIAANRIREIVANPDHVDRERPGKDDAFLAWLS